MTQAEYIDRALAGNLSCQKMRKLCQKARIPTEGQTRREIAMDMWRWAEIERSKKPQ